MGDGSTGQSTRAAALARALYWLFGADSLAGVVSQARPFWGCLVGWIDGQY